MQKRLYYKIGEACKMLDIQPYVLRYWETEFPALSPAKSRSGQRVYNEKELAVIRRIKELLYDEGYTIAGAKKKLEASWRRGRSGGGAGRRRRGRARRWERARTRSRSEGRRRRLRRRRRRAAEGAEQLALEAPPAPVARTVKPAPRLDTGAPSGYKPCARGSSRPFERLARSSRSSTRNPQPSRAVRSGRGAAW